MKIKSIWEEDLSSNYLNLNKNIECDILIIGGGISGILSAYYLNNSNLNIVLVERNKLLSATTSKMTAKVTLLQDILTKIDNKYLLTYLHSQLAGLNLLKSNINKLNIKCDFCKNDSYLYTTKFKNINKIKKIENIFNKLNIDIKKDKIPIKELKSVYSIKSNLSYEINPIKYLNSIIKSLNNVNIYENTNIIKVFKRDNYYNCLTSNNIIIKTKKVIFACFYPYFIKPLLFPLKVTLERANIVCGNSNYKGNYNLINIDKNINSIRFYKDKMIYLYDCKLISSFKNIINNKIVNNIDYYFTNMDIITNNYLPLVGEIEKNMYIITGYNTWGILSSHIGARYLSNVVLNNKEYLEYKKIFNPRKSLSIQIISNSFINICESIKGYIKGLKYLNNPQCPHLKCKLIYNKLEDTWDCPCHGSRFNKNGKIISGPAKKVKKCKQCKKK